MEGAQSMLFATINLGISPIWGRCKWSLFRYHGRFVSIAPKLQQGGMPQAQKADSSLKCNGLIMQL